MRRWLAALLAWVACLGTLALTSPAEASAVTWSMGHYHVTSDPASRTFYLQRPSTSGQRPLLIMLHGAAHTAGVAQSMTLLTPWAQAHEVVLVYGEGIGGRWNAGPECCDVPFGQVSTRDDVGYVAQVIAQAKLITGIDRVYVAGFSNGAMLADRVGCELPGIAGVAEVSGVLLTVPCAGPARVWARHGVGDTTVPVGGGRAYEGRVFPPWSGEAARFGLGSTWVGSAWTGGHAWSAPGKESAVNDLMWSVLSRWAG